VGYGLQLHEKQKAKRMYFTLEGQFREYYEKANRATGVTGELLIQQLERRLDNVATGSVSPSRAPGAAGGAPRPRHRQRRKVNIPSYQVQVGDEIAIRESARKLLIVEQARSTPRRTGSGMARSQLRHLHRRVLSLPRRKDVNLPINEQLIVDCTVSNRDQGSGIRGRFAASACIFEFLRLLVSNAVQGFRGMVELMPQKVLRSTDP